MGYESALSTQMMAQHCVFCGKALVDSVSVERGCGPDCAERFQRPDAEAPPDYAVINKGLDAAPEPFKTAVSELLGAGDLHGAVNRCIWHGSMAASYGGEHASEVLEWSRWKRHSPKVS